MGQKIKLRFGTVSKSEAVIPDNVSVIQDYMPHDMHHDMPHDMPHDNASRAQKWNRHVRDNKATFKFVMEKDELVRLKKHARDRNMTVTAMLKEAVSQFIQNNPV